MRRTSFGTLLIGLNAGLVLLAVIAVAAAAMGLIERFADEQGIARVDLAGAAAQEAIGRSVRDVRTSTHLLAERPTVKRPVEGGDAAGLAAFLDRFRSTSSLSAVAIFSQGKKVASGGAAVPWEAVLHGGETSSILRLPNGDLFLGAASPLASTPDATAAAAWCSMPRSPARSAPRSASPWPSSTLSGRSRTRTTPACCCGPRSWPPANRAPGA